MRLGEHGDGVDEACRARRRDTDGHVDRKEEVEATEKIVDVVEEGMLLGVCPVYRTAEIDLLISFPERLSEP